MGIIIGRKTEKILRLFWCVLGEIFSVSEYISMDNPGYPYIAVLCLIQCNVIFAILFLSPFLWCCPFLLLECGLYILTVGKYDIMKYN